jgi:hypothetical protein
MKTLYITSGGLALAAFSFAQSSARAAPPAAEARVLGATARKMGPDRDGYTLRKVLVIVDKGNPTAGTEGPL